MADKNYRDALTGQWATAADAANRPAETVAETTPTRHETPDVAELRHLLSEATPRPWEAEGSQLWGPDGVLVAAVREHSTIVDRPDARLIAAAVNSMESLLDAADALRAELAHIRESRAEAPDYAELRRRLDALPGFTLKHLHGGPGGESYIALGDEGGMPLSDSGFDAVLLFAEIAALDVPRLLDHLAHMTEARDNARAEVERLSAQVEAVRKWATACATQATDYDEDTEQQIEDGRKVLRILDGGQR